MSRVVERIPALLLALASGLILTSNTLTAIAEDADPAADDNAAVDVNAVEFTVTANDNESTVDNAFDEILNEAGLTATPASFESEEPGATASDCSSASQCCCASPTPTDPETVFGTTILDDVITDALSWRDNLDFPVFVGGYHWWAIDSSGGGTIFGPGAGGYGLTNYRGTYAYYTIAEPSYDLGDGQRVGAHAFFAGRDGDNYRQYYPGRFWFLEGYGFYSNEDIGTLKAGLVFTKFGLDSYGSFIGTAPYFEGFIQNADYGVSWEKTTDVDDGLSVETAVQFFFHEDGKNGSLAGFDSESVARVNERNKFIARIAPTWTCPDGSSIVLGLSGLVSEIDSTRVGFSSNARSAWGTDVTYRKGPFMFQTEMFQSFGRRTPARITSGGASNRTTGLSTETTYAIGAMTLRGMFSASYDANPDGRTTIANVGASFRMTPNADLYVEYIDWQVDGHAMFGSFTVLEGPQLTLHWHF